MFGGDESVKLMGSPDRQPTTAYEGCGRNLQVHVSAVGLTIVILCKLAYDLVNRSKIEGLRLTLGSARR